MKYFKDSFLDVARNPCQHKPQFSYGFQVNTFFQPPTENSHDFLNKTYLSLNALWFSICPFRDPKFIPKTQCLVLVTVLTYKWMKEIIIPQVIANALSCVPQNHYSHFSWALCLFSFYVFRQNIIQMALSFYFPSLTPFIRFTCVKMLGFFSRSLKTLCNNGTMKCSFPRLHPLLLRSMASHSHACWVLFLFSNNFSSHQLKSQWFGYTV